MTDDPMLQAALGLASRGWASFPLRGKVPAIAGGRGVLDATTDAETLRQWWAAYPRANVGCRVPEALFVLDVDPRHDGHVGLALLQAEYGELPATLTTISGRGDGGCHLYFRRPDQKVTARRLPPGLDLKTSSGYCVVPPSVHPDSGQPYVWGDLRMPVAAPVWLTSLLTEAAPAITSPSRRPRREYVGTSVIEAFNDSTSWADVLGPQGWRCSRGTGDSDGSVWLHPAATSSCSATVRGDRLYVYSPNTPFEMTETAAPRGYSRFDAWACLRHDGDHRAAASYFRTTGALA